MDGVVVVGQIGRDLVLRVSSLPDAGGSTAASDRRELLGGKGADHAAGLAQLRVPAALVGVVGDDGAGTAVLLTEDVVATATDRIAGRRALVLQLRQPGPAVRAALERVADGAMVVADGAPRGGKTPGWSASPPATTAT